MRTLLLIIFLSISGVLFAQDRYIEIPEADAPALKQYKINWHTGIDPVQIKDGTWVLNIEAVNLLPEKLVITDIAEKVITADLRVYLISIPTKVLTTVDFKEADEIEIKDPIDIKIVK